LVVAAAGAALAGGDTVIVGRGRASVPGRTLAAVGVLQTGLLTGLESCLA
jgi:hypothetical protein